VEELRLRVEAGTYHVAAERVADAIMRHRWRSLDKGLLGRTESAESNDDE
jgi:hypothetical protein